MRWKTMLFVMMLCFAAAVATDAEAAEARHFSFAYDQPHPTAYGIAVDTFANKLDELSHGTLIIDQFPGGSARPGTASLRVSEFPGTTSRPRSQRPSARPSNRNRL